MADIPLRLLNRTKEVCEITTDTNLKSLLRKMAIISLNGGIPIQLIDLANHLGANLGFNDFCRIGLPVNSWDQMTIDLDVIKFTNDFINNYPFNECEANLRSLLWDPVLIRLFTGGKVQGDPWYVASEFRFDKIVNLGTGSFPKIVDFVVVSKEFGFPILLVEIAKNSVSTSTTGHKDLAKLMALMVITCNNLAAMIKRSGNDPQIATVFGLFIAGTKFQLAIARPTIVSKADQDSKDIFSTVSSQEHWGQDLMCSTLSDHKFRCNRSCCCSSEISFYTSQVDENTLNLEGSDSNSVIPSNIEINEGSMKMLTGFFQCVKSEVIKLDNLNTFASSSDSSSSHSLIENDRLNLPVVFNFPASSNGPTPEKRRLNFKNTNTPSNSNVGTRLCHGNEECFTIEKGNSYENELYCKHFKGKFLFPSLIDTSSPLNKKDRTLFVFERMDPILGNNPESPFGPQFRIKQACTLLLDVVTLGLHILYSLFILHEEIGFIHSDISPNNILFSTKTGIWKLNDYNSAMPKQKSLETIRRKVGTSGFIAPESLESGIYTEESDVYSLGRVILDVFDLQIIYLYEMGDEDEEEYSILSSAYLEYQEIFLGMCKDDPKERLTVLEALKLALKFVIFYKVDDFKLYGWDNLLPEVSRLFELEELEGKGKDYDYYYEEEDTENSEDAMDAETDEEKEKENCISVNETLNKKFKSKYLNF